MKVNQRGFTLVEMLVVMAVFMVVLMITADSFKTIITQASKVFRSEESNIEGVVGLEMLRHDLQQAGYGLFSETATYTNEAAANPASLYNDTGTHAPRPIVVGNDFAAGVTIDATTIRTGSDYIAIKGTSVGRSNTAQKWAFLKFSSGVVSPNRWLSSAENLTSSPSEKVVLIQKQFGTPIRSSLINDPSNAFYFAYSDVGFAHLSSASAGIYTMYGVDTAATLRFPFNRTDYFVARPTDTSAMPSHCAPNTGTLYKTTVNHSNGNLNYVPVLDCVLDMQVVLGWDWDGDGIIDTYSNGDGTVASGAVTNTSAALSQANNDSIATTPSIRNNLKMIKVYVLAQNGQRDGGYTSPAPAVCDTGEASLTRAGTGVFSLAASTDVAVDQSHYRWKLYRVVVRPKNLLANQ